MSKNLVEPERLQRIWRMRVACWIRKAKARARTLAQLLLFRGREVSGSNLAQRTIQATDDVIFSSTEKVPKTGHSKFLLKTHNRAVIERYVTYTI